MDEVTFGQSIWQKSGRVAATRESGKEVINAGFQKLVFFSFPVTMFPCRAGVPS